MYELTLVKDLLARESARIGQNLQREREKSRKESVVYSEYVCLEDLRRDEDVRKGLEAVMEDLRSKTLFMVEVSDSWMEQPDDKKPWLVRFGVRGKVSA